MFEAAIPIAIIAVGSIHGIPSQQSSRRECHHPEYHGACSGAVVAGAIFTLPAIYILQAKYPEMSASFLKIFISSLLGGIIGILFLIPFRKYFVSDMHGKYPFPTAGHHTGSCFRCQGWQSGPKPLLIAGLVGGLYDFIVATFGMVEREFHNPRCGMGHLTGRQSQTGVQGQHRSHQCWDSVIS